MWNSVVWVWKENQRKTKKNKEKQRKTQRKIRKLEINHTKENKEKERDLDVWAVDQQPHEAVVLGDLESRGDHWHKKQSNKQGRKEETMVRK